MRQRMWGASSVDYARWAWPVLAILLLGVAGVSLFLLWGQRLPIEGSPEAAFARDMSTHHAQAVEMAFILYNRPIEAELKTLELDIFVSQQAQIGQMHGWLAAWGLPLAGPESRSIESHQMMGIASPEQISELRTFCRSRGGFSAIDDPPPSGGLVMAESVLRQTERPEVARLATAIVEAQQGEIDYMQTLLEQRGAALLPPMEMGK